jgi:hypothetical protein
MVEAQSRNSMLPASAPWQATNLAQKAGRELPPWRPHQNRAPVLASGSFCSPGSGESDIAQSALQRAEIHPAPVCEPEESFNPFCPHARPNCKAVKPTYQELLSKITVKYCRARTGLDRASGVDASIQPRIADAIACLDEALS